jgi:RimJ/RimL family protein N-acetyltransferase
MTQRFPQATDRTSFRELTSEDVAFVSALLSDVNARPLRPQEAEKWIDEQRRKYDSAWEGLWLIEEGSTPIGVGGIVSHPVEGERLAEIGLIIEPSRRRRRLATEAGLAIRMFAFEQLDLDEVVALLPRSNLAGQGLARKLGMLITRHVGSGRSSRLMYSSLSPHDRRHGRRLELRTKSLKLRPVSPDDVAVLEGFFSNPDPSLIAGSEADWKSHGFGIWIVEERSLPIGVIGFRSGDEKPALVEAFAEVPSEVMADARRAALDHAFRSLGLPAVGRGDRLLEASEYLGAG